MSIYSECDIVKLVGGINIQLEPGKIQPLGFINSLVATFLLVLMSVIFGNRYNYFNRVKINNTYMLFLAYKEKNSIKD